MPRGYYERPLRLPGAPKELRLALVAGFMSDNMEVYANAAGKLHEWCKTHPIDPRLLDYSRTGRMVTPRGPVPGIEAHGEAPRLPSDVENPGGRPIAVLDRSPHDQARSGQARSGNVNDLRRATHRDMKRRLAELKEAPDDKNAPA